MTVDVRILVSMSVMGKGYSAVVSAEDEDAHHIQIPVGPKLSRLGLIGTRTMMQATDKTEAAFKKVAEEFVETVLESDWSLGDPTVMRSKWNTGTQDWDLIDDDRGDLVRGWVLEYDKGQGAKPVVLGTCKGLKQPDLVSPASVTACPVLVVQYTA